MNIDIPIHNQAAFHLLALADHAVNQGDFAAAYEQVEECIRRYPDFGPVYNHLAWLKMTQGELEAVEPNYRKAIELSPLFHSTYVNLAIFLNAQGRFQDVLGLVDTAIVVPGARKDILFHEKGISLELLGDFEGAVAAFKESMRNCIQTQDVERNRDAIHRNAIKQAELGV